ncbi:beta-secretase 2 [Suricata suricatta]|uniref:beta-secretase 2 n=1 Tax=Suricata suricatta TaxID=37032 RepID=UPI001155C88D|nr:beta-secretase 2 [Suricata suricatta]
MDHEDLRKPPFAQCGNQRRAAKGQVFTSALRKRSDGCNYSTYYGRVWRQVQEELFATFFPDLQASCQTLSPLTIVCTDPNQRDECNYGVTFASWRTCQEGIMKQMSLVTSVGRSSGARSEEIRDSSFPGKRRGPRRASAGWARPLVAGSGGAVPGDEGLCERPAEAAAWSLLFPELAVCSLSLVQPPSPAAAAHLQILVDTGSSNFAVAGAPHSYIDSYFDTERSSTYRSKGFDVTVKYTQGSWTGFVGEDVVTIPKGFNSSFLVNIATIFESENFFLPGVKWSGILGLAYAALAKPSSSLETFFDSLVAQARIPNIFSMQMCGAGLPITGPGTNGGSLVLGGIEPSLYKGDIWYTPIKEEWYYQIEILKLEIGGQSLNLDCREYNADKAIVDSGTTLLRLPQKVFDAVVEAVARTSLIPEFSDGFWTGSQLACWTNSETPWAYFPKISIYLRDENSSQSFRLTILPQLYIQPMMGAGLNYECYRFGISPSANALVIGATVMEGFYVVFDRARKRVGFAASPCAEIAGAPVSEISGPFSTDDIASNCVPALPLNEPILWIVSYTLMSVCGLILLTLIVLLLLPFRCRPLPRDPEVNDESSLVRHRWK